MSPDALSSLSPSNAGERVQAFLRATLQGSPAKSGPQVPAALRHAGAELEELSSAVGRIVHFNRSVFGPVYAGVLRNLLFPPGQDEAGEDSR